MFSGTAYPLGLKERKHMNKAASQYLREVKKRIHCSRSLKTEFLFQLEDEVDFFCEDFDGVDFAALEKRFGKPEDVAKEFLSELGGSALTKANRFQRSLAYLFIIVVITAAILAFGVSVYTDYKQQKALDSYYVESITYEGELSPGATSPTYEAEFFTDEDNP